MLEKLKAEHSELLHINNIKCGKLGTQLQAYSKMFTAIDLRDLNELEQCEAYERANNALKAKQEHTEDFIKAFKDKNEELLLILDVFKEIIPNKLGCVGCVWERAEMRAVTCQRCIGGNERISAL